jgi:hypothetical protein
MREISKFCKICCHQNHKKWTELVPYIENWLNTTISGSAGYTLVQLIFDEDRPDLFEKLIKKSSEQLPATETLEDTIYQAYARMRRKAEEMRRRRKNVTKQWKPQPNDKVLVKCQPTSDTLQ